MDYKYIEQLLERYWNCETSAEEEQILRIFFQQKEVPAYLRRYQSLFIYQEKAGNMKLGNDFEERILNEIERPVVKARHLSLYTRFQQRQSRIQARRPRAHDQYFRRVFRAQLWNIGDPAVPRAVIGQAFA